MSKRGSVEWKEKIGLALSKKVGVDCDMCGNFYQEKPSHFKRKKRHFCQMSCYAKFRAKRLPREEQHAYKNGGIPEEEKKLRIKARSDLNHAIRSGKLKRLPCEKCGNKKVEAHHHDYSKPLSVFWLCDGCHHKIHENPELLK